jgi:hypothetical protein
VWSIGGTILTGESEVLGENHVPVPKLYTKIEFLPSRKHRICIIKTSYMTLFKEITADGENHTGHTNTLYRNCINSKGYSRWYIFITGH